MFVRELEDGQDLDVALLVRGAEVRSKRDGGDYLRLTLGDRTGAVAGILWDSPAAATAAAKVGAVLVVSGRYALHPRFGPQITVRSLRPAQEAEYEIEDLLDGPLLSADRMESDLRELLETVSNPHLGRLLDRFFGAGEPTWLEFREAPAAKYYHQAYRHGLLEHCLTVAQAVRATAGTFPGVDGDLALAGALLHDIGKLEAYLSDPRQIDLTDAGKLEGEIPLGYYRVRRAIEELEGFPPDLAQALLHIILSHHGTLEHGSPVVPCTREATLVHMIDNLGGRLGSFDRLEKELPDGQRWSGFDRALGGGAFFATSAAHVASK